MGTLLVRHAEALVTMDGREIADGGLFARDGVIVQVGDTAELPDGADHVVDLTGHVVLPGLINTHHHLYQTLTRVVPAAQSSGLFDWLRALYPIWSGLTPEHVRVATTLGLAELALSGCTTAFDHQYLWPGGSRVDDQVEGADQVGLRFHVSRGSMTLGESAGGLPPDSIVEDEDEVLADSQRVIEMYHDATPGAMTRVVLAPCSPFTVTSGLMTATASAMRHRVDRLP
ncbi:MAG: amidohydrolase family protein, partial [Acidimicrobiia bacterium]